MMRDSAPLVITMSLRTMWSAKTPSSRDVRAASIARVSIVARPVERRLERVVELRQRDLGQEPEAAEVDAEDRHVAARRAAMRPAMPISVPSPPSTTIRSHSRGRSSRETVGRPRGHAGQRAPSRSRRPARTSRASSQPASSASTPDGGARGRASPSRPTRGCRIVRFSHARQVQEELAVAFGAGDRRLGHRDARQS